MDGAAYDIPFRGLASVGGVVIAFAMGWVSHYWQMRKMRAEYEDLKAKRKLTNAKGAEQAELLSRHADTVVKLKEAGVTAEQFQAYVNKMCGRKRRRAKATG